MIRSVAVSYHGKNDAVLGPEANVAVVVGGEVARSGEGDGRGNGLGRNREDRTKVTTEFVIGYGLVHWMQLRIF